MGIISIVINLITIMLVSLILYITFLAFNKREARDKTWLQTFARLWSSDKEINKTLSDNTPVYGDIGSFEGQDWNLVPNVSVEDADNQDSLAEFIGEGKPNIIGTK